MAIDGQRAFDDAHDLLDLLVAESGATVRVERFTGHMGMFTLEPARGPPAQQPAPPATAGCGMEACLVSEDAEFLDEIPAEFAALYTVVPQARIRELLETDDDRYRAVLSDRKGCANSGLLVQQVLAYLERRYPDRFRYADRTQVERVVVGATASSRPRRRPRGARGSRRALHQRLRRPRRRGRRRRADPAGRRISGSSARVGFMAAFAEERAAHARGDELHPQRRDRRRHARTSTSPGAPTTGPDGTVTLTCMGGPEWPHRGA